jgi:hypothetical protein
MDAKADHSLKSAVAGVPARYTANQVTSQPFKPPGSVGRREGRFAPPLALAGGGGRRGGNNRNAAGGAGAANGQTQRLLGASLQRMGCGGGFVGGRGNRGEMGGNRGGLGHPARASGDAAADDGGTMPWSDCRSHRQQGGGLTALIFASRQGDLNRRSSSGGWSGHQQPSDYGWTPLLTATQNRHYILGTYLMEHGADVNLANKSSWTNLYLATDNRNIEGGDFPVPKADMDSLEYIRALLDHKADVNSRYVRTRSPARFSPCSGFLKGALHHSFALRSLVIPL